MTARSQPPAWLLGAVLLLSFATPARPQDTQPAQPTHTPEAAATYRIAGRVVDALTAHALAAAKIEIRSTAGGLVVATAQADPEGHFAFASVKPGAYALQGEARGYTTAAYDAHGVYSSAIVTGAGVDTESLVLKLSPEARVSGRILDESGEAVRHAAVQLFRENRASGTLRIERQRNAQTDDLGQYEIARLPPGRYYLAAQATPWYAVHPQPPQNQNTFSNVGIVDSLDPGLNVAYSMLFYPGVTDSSAASALALKGGEQMEIDLRLVPQPAVSITVPLPLGNRNVNFQGLQTMLFGELQPVTAMMQSTPEGMTFEGIPAGRYVLKQNTSQPGGIARTYTVDASAQSVVVEDKSAQQLGSVVLHAESADGSPLPPQMQMALLSGDARPATPVFFGGKTEGKAEGVAPGTYRLVRNGGMAGYFLVKVTVDGEEMPGARIPVAPGAATTATVVVGTGTAALNGRAMRDGKPVAGAMVLLVPADESIADDTFWRDQTDLDGSFRLLNVPPGNYLLVAIADGWELEWKRPEVLARYLPHGLAVVVPQGLRSRIKLTDVTAQPR